MGNLSQTRRAEMLEYLNHLKEIHTDDESRIALSKIETALTEKKYGLVWEEHEEEVDKQLVHNIPVFREIEDKKIIVDENADFNFLLEGDNLHSLKLLEKTHKGKIDVIYIDPPYNTKNKEFIYNDTKIGEDDGYRHSKWLSFMNERLVIAKELLSDEGVIFISIDDNEQAQLKLLCDEIFDERNFIGCICRATGTTTGQDANKIGSSLDYCLSYSKTNKFVLKGIPLNEKDLKRFKDKDEKGLYSTLQLRKTGNEDRKEDRPNMFYSVKAPDGTDVFPFGPTNYLSRWRVAESTYKELLNENMIVWKKKKTDIIVIDGYEKSEWVPYVKYYATGRTKKVSNLFQDIDGNKKASLELKNIIGTENKFDYPKPVEFIKILLQIASEKDSVILDYFAGSGTTGQAVMQIDKEDGGNRKYILCTNNENNICEKITYKRMKNIQEELPHNLKYYKTEFIPKLSEDEEILSSKLLDYIKEMVELENMCEIDGDSRRIILSDEDLKIALSEMEESGVLYIPSFILLTNEIKDSIEERKLEVVTIPDYYFTEELREVNEL